MALPSPCTLETVTGKFVDLINPDPADICIEDIAWSLSRLARFNGHTIQALPYTVAQHSIVVAEEAARLMKLYNPKVTEAELSRIALLGLLHDASEAYTGDVAGPLKKIPDFRVIIKRIEHTIQEAIYKALNIASPSEADERIVKEADLIAQRVEAYNFMVSRGMNWSNMPEVSIIKLQQFEMPTQSVKMYERFLSLYETCLTEV